MLVLDKTGNKDIDMYSGKHIGVLIPSINLSQSYILKRTYILV